MDRVNEELIQSHWIDDGLLYASGGLLYIPTCKLGQKLIDESYDTQWAGHQGRYRMFSLMSRVGFWPRMEADIKSYVRSYLVGQQHKVERKLEAGYFSPYLHQIGHGA